MAHYIETWGVFLGFAVPCMGGWLLCRPRLPLEWGWCYEGVRAAISSPYTPPDTYTCESCGAGPLTPTETYLKRSHEDNAVVRYLCQACDEAQP